MTLTRQVTVGLKWQALAIIGRQLLALAVFGTLARLLQPSDFGQVALLGVYTIFLSILTDLGLSTSLVQRTQLTREHIDTAFWFLLTFGLVAWTATAVFSDAVAAALGGATPPQVVLFYSLAFAIRSVATVHGALLARELNFKVPAVRTLIASIVAGFVAIGFAIAGCGVWALVAQELVAASVGTILYWLSSSYRPSFYFSLSRLQELARVGVPVHLNATLWFFSSKADYYIIGRVLGAHDLGLYSVGYKLPDIIRTATHQPLTEVLVPSLARLQSDLPKLRNALYKGAALNSVIIFPVFSGLAVLAQDLIYVLFGPSWIESAQAASLLSVYLLISATQVFFYPALIASGVSRGYIALTCFQSAGTVLSCWIGVHFGVVGVAAALICNGCATAVFATVLLTRRIGLSPSSYFGSCIGPLASAIIMCGVVTGAEPIVREMPQWLRLLVNIALGAASYIAFMSLFFRAQSHAFVMFFKESFLRRPVPLPTT